MIKTYYLLTKPGIIFGNILTLIAGFALASKGNVDYILCFKTVLGLSLVIASACVFNNFIDRSIDQKMKRTENRPLAKGLISSKKALFFAASLGISGFCFLIFWTNLLTVSVAATGFFVYVVLYSISKCRTSFGTLIGSVSGAVPPVVGYTAITDRLDLASILLFAVLVLWQMPHFFSIAIYRLEDYTKALIPVLPVKKGLKKTQVQMVLYIIAFMIASLLLSFLHYTGTFFLVTALILSLWWLILGLRGFKSKDSVSWGKKMFRFSLLTITLMCLIIPWDVT